MNISGSNSGNQLTKLATSLKNCQVLENTPKWCPLTASVNTTKAGTFTFLLASIFGKRSVVFDAGYHVTISVWYGKPYAIKYEKV